MAKPSGYSTLFQNNQSGETTASRSFYYKVTEANSSQVKVSFSIDIELINYSYVGTGYGVDWTITINGVSKDVAIKDNNDSWSTNSSHTITGSITCNKTSSGDLSIKITDKNTGNLSDRLDCTKISYSGTIKTSYPASTPPTTPSSITATPSIFERSVTIKWGASSISAGTISNYELEVQTNGGSWTDLANPTSTSYTYTPNVSRGTTLKYRVRCKNTNNQYSDWRTLSSTIKKNEIPSKPTLSISPTDVYEDSLTINWTASKDDGSISNYTLYYCNETLDNDNWITLYTGTSRTFNFTTNIARGNKLKFRVRAKDDLNVYSNYSNIISVKKNSIPGIPSNIYIKKDGKNIDINTNRVNINSGKSLEFSWSESIEPDNQEVTYEVYLQKKIENVWTTVLTKSNLTSNSLTINYDDITSGIYHLDEFRLGIKVTDSMNVSSEIEYSANYITIDKSPSPPQNCNIINVLDSSTKLFFDQNKEINISFDNGFSEYSDEIFYDILITNKQSGNISWNNYINTNKISLESSGIYSIIPNEYFDYTGRGLYKIAIKSFIYENDEKIYSLNSTESFIFSENFYAISKSHDFLLIAKRLEPEIQNGDLNRITLLLDNGIKKSYEVSFKLNDDDSYNYTIFHSYIGKDENFNNESKLSLMRISKHPLDEEGNVLDSITDINSETMRKEIIDKIFNEFSNFDESIQNEKSDYELDINNNDYDYFIILGDYYRNNFEEIEFTNINEEISYKDFSCQYYYNNSDNIREFPENYNIVRLYDFNLGKPVFNFLDEPYSSEPIKDEEGNPLLDENNNPITINTYFNSLDLNVEYPNSLYLDNKKILTSYTRSYVDDETGISSFQFEDISENTVYNLTLQGEYSFISYIELEFLDELYGNIIKTDSDINNSNFVILSGFNTDLIIPKINTTYNINNNKQVADVEISVENDDVHCYYIEIIKQSNGEKLIVTTEFSNVDTSNEFNYDIEELLGKTFYKVNNNIIEKIFDEADDYTINVYVVNTLNNSFSYVSSKFSVFEIPEIDTAFIESLIKHDSISTDNNILCNDIGVTLKAVKDEEKYIYLVNYYGKNYLINDKYSLYFFNNDENFSITQYYFSNLENLIDYINEGTSCFPEDFTFSDISENPITGIDSYTIPPKPIIKITSDTKLGSFDHYLNNIKIEITNKNDDSYVTECYIDGKPYEEGTSYECSGPHYFFVIFKDSHNYTLNYNFYQFALFKENLGSNPKIDYYVPNDENWKKYNYDNELEIKITWFIDPEEEENIIKKEYDVEINGVRSGWKDYTEPFKVTENCIIYARKTLSNTMVLESSLEINTINIKAPDPPKISDIIIDGTNGNNSIYIPFIEKILGYSYNLTINGLPYIEGTPITNYNRNIRNFVLKLLVTDNYNDKQTLVTKNITIDTIPPNKPEIDLIEHYKIENIDKLDNITITNYEDGVIYFASLNGKELTVQDNIILSPFESEDDYNKSYVLIITAKKISNGMSNSSFFYFDINRYKTTDEMHTLLKPRNVFIPASSENNFFEYSKELIINERTGDLSITSEEIDENGSHILINITEELKEKIYNCNNIIGQHLKMQNLQFEQLRFLYEGLPNIIDNNELIENYNQELNNKLNELQNHLNSMQDEVQTTQNNINDFIKKYNEFNISLNDEFKGLMDTINSHIGDYELGINDSNSPIYQVRENIILMLKDYYQNISYLEQCDFNLDFISNIIKEKVTQEDFNNFKNKHNEFYNDIKNKISDYSKGNDVDW